LARGAGLIDLAGLLFGFAKRGQEQAGEDCDDRNDDQQLQQSEPTTTVTAPDFHRGTLYNSHRTRFRLVAFD
jgi:hypothetical protein